MAMKKVSCAIIVAAASMSAVMAVGAASAPTPLADGLAPSAAFGSASAPAPGSSGAAAALPVLGSLVGASIVSLLSYVLQ